MPNVCPPIPRARYWIAPALITGWILAGCCPANENTLRIVNASSEVLLDVRTFECGAANQGPNRANIPIFLGETRRYDQVQDGCQTVRVRGDLGGVWEYEVDLGCGEDRAVTVESDF